jgi:hypothetical protein
MFFMRYSIYIDINNLLAILFENDKVLFLICLHISPNCKYFHNSLYIYIYLESCVMMHRDTQWG